jgi:hypothetical protein
MVERRYKSDRNNPFRARCSPEILMRIPLVRSFVARFGKWIIEPNTSVLRSKQLPKRPGHCAGFEFMAPLADGTEQSAESAARFIDAPLALTIEVAERVRTAGARLRREEIERRVGRTARGQGEGRKRTVLPRGATPSNHQPAKHFNARRGRCR